MFDLSGKAALVTGASGSIGGAIARSLHAQGATVNDIVLSCSFATLKSSLLSFRFARITALRLDGVLCDESSPADCS